MMFKFTPRLFDIISEMIRGTHEQIRTNEREIMRYAVRRGRMDRNQFRTTFPEQESNPAWLDEQIAKASAETKAHLKKYALTYWHSNKKLQTLRKTLV
jgi:RNA polymerase primary sigma factor